MPTLRAIAVCVPVAAVLSAASPAVAAFPGADGVLAVQPRFGGGIVLIAPDGRGQRRICARSAVCGRPRRPRWSPDGRALVFAGPAVRVVYPDGSCLDCQFGPAGNPAFEPGGTLVSFSLDGRVTVDGIDSVRKAAPGAIAASDAVWSAGGRLAVLRAGVLWAGRPGRLVRMASATQPSWSPAGTTLAAVQRGWIVLIRLRDRHLRRLVRGSAPAFSPDGRWLAYVAPNHRLMIVGLTLGQATPRAVGRLQALSVDWQPRPRRRVAGCAVPPGSTVLARSSDAVVTGDGWPETLDFDISPAVAYMGCLRSDGRERLLERFAGNNVDGASFVVSAAVAAPYAALVREQEDIHYGGSDLTVQVFNLRTGGPAPRLGGEEVACPGYAVCGTLDDLVLGRDGVSAAHVDTLEPIGWGSTPIGGVACAPATTLCLAADSYGYGHLLTSTTPPGGAGAWSVGTVGSGVPTGPSELACPSASLCVGVGIGTQIYASTDRAGGASTWTSSPLATSNDFFTGVSCPTVTVCVAARSDGSVVASSNPAGGPGAWMAARIDSRPLGAVFCSDAPRCFVVDSAGTVFTSSDPTGGPGAWAVSSGTPRSSAGSCPTVNLCVAVYGNQVMTTTDPSAGVWTTSSLPVSIGAIDCPSASLCVGVGLGGALAVSTDPASGVWTAGTIDAGRELNAIACPSTSLCVAVDSSGHVVTSTDPTGGASTWVPALVQGDPCADTTPCSAEAIQASDRTGVHTVDASRMPGAGPFLTGLALSGDTLSWSHAGSPRRVTLTP